jgi:hypothetical protein
LQLASLRPNLTKGLDEPREGEIVAKQQSGSRKGKRAEGRTGEREAQEKARMAAAHEPEAGHHRHAEAELIEGSESESETGDSRSLAGSSQRVSANNVNIVIAPTAFGSEGRARRRMNRGHRRILRALRALAQQQRDGHDKIMEALREARESGGSAEGPR